METKKANYLVEKRVEELMIIPDILDLLLELLKLSSLFVSHCLSCETPKQGKANSGPKKFGTGNGILTRGNANWIYLPFFS